MCEKKSSPKLLVFFEKIIIQLQTIFWKSYSKCSAHVSSEVKSIMIFSKKNHRSFGDDFFTHSKLARNNNELINQEIYGEKIKTLEKEKLSHFYFRNFPNMF